MKSPPRWIVRWLEKRLDHRLFDEIYGDLLEDFHRNSTKSHLKANWLFVLSASGYVRYQGLHKISSTPNSNAMSLWQNTFVSSIRNLKRNKLHTGISLLGLIIGFAAATAIFQYTLFERSYDSFHRNADRKYRLTHTFENATSITENATTYLAVKEAIAEVPEIRTSTHFLNIDASIRVDDNIFTNQDMIATNSDFFDVFDFNILSGQIDDLNKPNFVAISETTATTFFGSSQDIIGKQVEIQNLFGLSLNVSIGAIYQDIPENSHLRADFIFPLSQLLTIARNGNFFGNIQYSDLVWRWFGYPTYIEIGEGDSKDLVEQKINSIISRFREPYNAALNQKHSVWLQPIKAIHITPGVQSELKPNNDVAILQLFAAIGFFILLLAWTNHINISTARAMTRAKEVGVRKVLGSDKRQLQLQFLMESLLLNTGGFALAIGLLFILGPYIEGVVAIPFFGNLYQNYGLMTSLFAMVVVGSILSGLYPAISLSNFSLQDTLRGKLKHSRRGTTLRRILVIVQFSCTIFLVSALFTVQHQMSFMLSADLGANIDRTLLITGHSSAASSSTYRSRMSAFQNELKLLPGIEELSISSIVPGIRNGFRVSTEARNGEEAGLFVHRSSIDEEYFDFYDIELIAGRSFHSGQDIDGTTLIVNKKTTEELGFESPELALQQPVIFAGIEHKIIGVVEDFYQLGVQQAVEPISFTLDTAYAGNYISLRTSASNTSAIEQQVQSLFEHFFPDSPFTGRVMENVFMDQYNGEEQFRDLFSMFSIVALAIAILGLVGLSSYIVSQRMKEVSVRKVLGAHDLQLFVLLNREYLVLSAISFVIAIPAATILSSQWLDNYANHITLGPLHFVVPLIIVITSVFLTTLGYTIKLIRVNPATVLKQE